MSPPKPPPRKATVASTDHAFTAQAVDFQQAAVLNDPHAAFRKGRSLRGLGLLVLMGAVLAGLFYFVIRTN